MYFYPRLAVLRFHVDGSVDPLRDIETINLELIFSDLEVLERRLSKVAKAARMDKTCAREQALLERIKEHLESGKPVKTLPSPGPQYPRTRLPPVSPFLSGTYLPKASAARPALCKKPAVFFGSFAYTYKRLFTG